MIAGARATCRLTRLRRCAAAVLAAASLGACAPGVYRPAPARIPADPSPRDSGVELADGTLLPNLAAIKQEIVTYRDTGDWERRVTAIAQAATERLDAELPAASGRPAVVLDIDDTALSTFEIQRHVGFGWVPSLWQHWAETETAPPRPGILAFYRHARERGIAVFFVTGRREHLRTATERQLRAAGYDAWEGLYLKPDDYAAPSVVPYKSGVRHSLQAKGFDILINIGDQWSDLEGGFARVAYKLPNPMYYRR